MDRDLACGLISLAIALFYLSAAGSIPESNMGDTVGAAGMPFVLGYCLAAVSLCLVGWRLVALRSGQASRPQEQSRGIFDHPIAAFLSAAGTTAICAVFVFLFEPIGYIPSVALLILAMLLYQRVRPSVRLLITAAGGAVVLWVMFAVLLSVRMPVGAWADLL